MLKLKKKLCYGILIVLAVVACFAVTVLWTTQNYPQIDITSDQLYGMEQENLKDFTLDSEGVLTATSDDPWIMYQLPQSMKVRSVEITLSDVQQDNSVMQCFLAPDYTSAQVSLNEGTVKVVFTAEQSHQKSEGIRFDLTNHVGNSMRVEKIVVNSRADFISKIVSIYICVLCLLTLITVEALLWWKRAKQQKDSSEKISRKVWLLTGIGLQSVAKLAAIGALLPLLTLTEEADHQRLLSWMLFFGMELTCIAGQVVRRFEKQNHMWYQLLMLPFWSMAIFAMLELTNTVSNFSFHHISYLLLNLLVCCVPVLVVTLLVRRISIPMTVFSVVYTVLGLANHFFGLFRGNPLEYSDIAQAGTALNVIDNYDLTPDATCIAAVLMVVSLSISLFLSLGNQCWHWKKTSAVGGISVGMGAVLLASVVLPSYGMTEAWGLPGITNRDGYLVSFVSYTVAGLKHEKPSGYSASYANQVLEHAAESESSGTGEKKLPNIIVIMNETFADLPSIYQFETDEELLPFIDQMEENTIKGYLLTSVFGGGTSNTEYEFLTGNSLYALPANSCPYVQYMSHTQQSIAWNLKSLGYQTLGYHPFAGSGYRRAENYPLLGFDAFYDIATEFPNCEYYRGFLSDHSDFANLIYLYEQRDREKPFFAFNVTMQNHGSYNDSSEARIPITVQALDSELQLPQMDEYLSLVHESDQAFSELVEYFSQVEEDTIILMFGDHQPSLGEQGNNLLAERAEGQTLYGTNVSNISSFVLWANFDIEEADDVLSSPNYLRALLLNQAGVELNAYEQFLLDLSQQYPAINSNGYYDAERVWHPSGESEPQPILDYKCLVYNNVFDKRHMMSEYYEHQ